MKFNKIRVIIVDRVGFHAIGVKTVHLKFQSRPELSTEFLKSLKRYQSIVFVREPFHFAKFCEIAEL